MPVAFFYLDDVVEAAKDLPELMYFQSLPGADEYDRHLLGYDCWLRGSLVSSELAECREHGHDIVDCSSAGPDSGNMDHYCRRCGAYFSVPLY